MNEEPLTATQVQEMERAYWADWAERQAAENKDDPLLPLLERMLEIALNESLTVETTSFYAKTMVQDLSCNPTASRRPSLPVADEH